MSRRLLTVSFLLFSLIGTPLVFATDPPRALWLKAKCALCHGEKGDGATQAGTQVKVPDLRAPEIQKLTDEELGKRVSAGHGKMPAFKARLTPQEVSTLVVYIRELAAKTAK